MSKKLQPLVLIIEDEEAVASVMRYNLEKEGYTVMLSGDGAEGLDMIKQYKPDVVLLDRVLPSLSGIDICRIVRDTPEVSGVPIIIISAHGDEVDKIFGLDRGADDYLPKPFSPQELMARIRAVLRRIRPAFSNQTLKFEDIEMNLDTHIVMRHGREVRLSPIEFKILHMLIEVPGRVFSRDTLMDKIWGGDVHVGMRTIDVHITRLRKALVEYGGLDFVRTVRLGGYTLKHPREK
jgi:two-component system phosphate regulon response regulator PhoB